jgi:hypothetical protein
MGYKDAKHRNVYSVTINPDGGLNYALSAKNIADNELRVARNLLYDAQTGKPMTRPGTRCVSSPALAAPILRMHYYEKSATQKWLVCASAGKLYQMVAGTIGYLVTEGGDYLTDESGNRIEADTEWTEIGSLTDDDTVPSFLTYNSKLLIADGGENIRTWDGTTYTTLDDGLYATALATIKGRVVANSSDLDLVTLTGPADETKWNTSTDGAVGLRAGFGDGLTVNGFAVFGDNLIISKKGDVRKTLYRLNVSDATTTNWYVQMLSENNCAQNHQSIISAFQNVFFADTNGFKSLKGVTEYGDLEVDVTGSKINLIFGDAPTCHDMAYIPAYNAIFFCVGQRVWVCHRITTPGGDVKYSFTDLVFLQGQIRCCVQIGTKIYLAGYNGYLYEMDADYATDETVPSTTSAFSSQMKTKSFSVMGDLIVRRMKVDMVPKVAGAGSITANTTTLQTFTISAAGQLLCDATGYLAADTSYLYDGISAPWSENVRNRYRDDEIAYGITTTSGRIMIENIAVDMAMVEGQ